MKLPVSVPHPRSAVLRAGTLSPAPAPKKLAEPGSVTDDGARLDGGNTTEDQPVSEQKMSDLGRSAMDHTREQAGS